MPCHFGGQLADMDEIGRIAAKHGIHVVEDAAHAHGSEWRGRKAGSIGVAGTFSFQNAKNMTSGEGGIVITSDPRIADLVESYTWSGREKGQPWYEFHRLGWNNRLTEFQAAILRVQLTRLEEQNAKRRQNALSLSRMLEQIGGLRPIRIDERGAKTSCHIYMLRYDPASFDGLPRAKLIEALNAEGIPAFSGYTHALYNNPLFVKHAFHAPESPKDYRCFAERCPVSERAVASEAVWLEHRLFLGPPQDMQDIAEAFAKVKKHARELL
jgi:dTDP-4-amino-4,6-dideoxygalactose transaminase